MTAEEFDYWKAYYEIEPFGQARGDLQAGIVAAGYINTKLKEGIPRLGPGDFLLTFRDTSEPEEEEEGDDPDAIALRIDRALFGAINKF